VWAGRFDALIVRSCVCGFSNLSILLGFFIADNWQSCFDFEWNFPRSPSQHLKSTFKTKYFAKIGEYVPKTPYSQQKIRAFKNTPQYIFLIDRQK
jgi:hypothetical protein